jgi:hypothetical protein
MRPRGRTSAWRASGRGLSCRGMSDKRIGARLRLGELVLQMSIRDACDADCESFFMGASSGIRSLERFKERMGARPHAVAEHRLERLLFSRLQRRLHAARLRLENSPSPAPRVEAQTERLGCDGVAVVCWSRSRTQTRISRSPSADLVGAGVTAAAEADAIGVPAPLPRTSFGWGRSRRWRRRR